MVFTEILFTYNYAYFRTDDSLQKIVKNSMLILTFGHHRQMSLKEKVEEVELSQNKILSFQL